MSSNPPYRLLLIEPSATTAAPIRALLEHNQYQVEVVSTIAEARARDLTRFAVLIVDVRREDRDGLVFVQWLHQVHSHLAGRVVVISADDSKALEQDLTALGVCDVVPKPVNAEEILRAVMECLGKNPALAVQ
jgi:DNA-binding response OmpR family regulator